MRETAIQGHSRSYVVVLIDGAYDFLHVLALSSNLTSIFNRSGDNHAYSLYSP